MGLWFDPARAQAFGGFRAQTAARFYGVVTRLARCLDVEVEGLEHVPAGRALIVANHAFGFDVAFAIGAIRARTGREVFVLGEHLFFRVPLVRGFAARVGTVDGTNENADALLSHDQLVLVLPGGMREAVKPRELRYRLLWGERYGFVRTAIRNQAPVVPLATIGADDVFEFVGDAVARGRRVFAPLGVRGVPIPLPHRLHPHLRLRYVLGEPVAPTFPKERAEDPAALRALRRTIEGALHELLDRELARRAHVSLA